MAVEECLHVVRVKIWIVSNLLLNHRRKQVKHHLIIMRYLLVPYQLSVQMAHAHLFVLILQMDGMMLVATATIAIGTQKVRFVLFFKHVTVKLIID